VLEGQESAPGRGRPNPGTFSSSPRTSCGKPPDGDARRSVQDPLAGANVF
jgi:hypothetical protein